MYILSIFRTASAKLQRKFEVAKVAFTAAIYWVELSSIIPVDNIRLIWCCNASGLIRALPASDLHSHPKTTALTSIQNICLKPRHVNVSRPCCQLTHTSNDNIDFQITLSHSKLMICPYLCLSILICWEHQKPPMALDDDTRNEAESRQNGKIVRIKCLFFFLWLRYPYASLSSLS